VTFPDPDYSDPEFADTELGGPAPASAAENARDALAERIEAGRQRLAQRMEDGDMAAVAKQAADDAVEFTKKHPFAVIAGAIGAGLVIGAMTKPGRKATKQVAKRSSVMAVLASEAALAFGMEALSRFTETAGNAKQSGRDRLEDMGDAVGSTARKLRRDTTYKAEAANDAVRSASRKASRKTTRTIRDVRARLKS
jgi:ElaB/YqjD/DUF883 family membrane-anchored ribosome-binding protein